MATRREEQPTGPTTAATQAAERRIEAEFNKLGFDNEEGLREHDAIASGIQNGPILTESVTRERTDPLQPPGLLRTSEKIQKRYGVKDGEVMIGIRDPARYEESEIDRAEILEDQYNSFRVLTKEGGKPIKQGDLIMCAVSREDYERFRKNGDQAAKETDERFRQGTVEGHSGAIKQFESDEDALKRQRAQTHEYLARHGGERWPKSMSLEEIQEKVGVEALKELRFTSMLGGRSEREGERERYEEWMSGGSSKGKNRSFSGPGGPTRR